MGGIMSLLLLILTFINILEPSYIDLMIVFYYSCSSFLFIKSFEEIFSSLAKELCVYFSKKIEIAQ